jgi:hypothetical protein
VGQGDRSTVEAKSLEQRQKRTTDDDRRQDERHGRQRTDETPTPEFAPGGQVRCREGHDNGQHRRDDRLPEREPCDPPEGVAAGQPRQVLEASAGKAQAQNRHHREYEEHAQKNCWQADAETAY